MDDSSKSGAGTGKEIEMKKSALYKPLFFILFLVLLYGIFTVFFPEEKPVLNGPYHVVRIIDGDTIVVDIGGQNTTIRLIGVDAPESVHPDEEQNTPEGIAASNWMEELLSGKSVFLEYDVELYDTYGRTLAYVYLEDATTMVNLMLLEENQAECMIIAPNTKYEDLFISVN